MNDGILKLIKSWTNTDETLHSTKELLDWITRSNDTISVSIHKISLQQDTVWHYIEDEGIIANAQRSFFTISGIKKGSVEQPILLQNEIGYLGILCKEIDGVLHLLMQAKIEPGNINKIQISPTVQATKSNFMQKHGGNRPAYLDY
ncbi:MAG: NDP-hexose 2,3-dehydratase family protein, partial [Christensenellaceae bacterium]